MYEERSKGSDVETWQLWNRFTKDLPRRSANKPLSDALNVLIDEGKPIYSGDRSSMASRWAVTEAMYPAATQSFDDHIAEWPSYEDRQEEEGDDMGAKLEAEEAIVTRYTKDEMMRYNPVMNMSWVCVESIEALNAALINYKFLDRHKCEDDEEDEEL